MTTSSNWPAWSLTMACVAWPLCFLQSHPCLTPLPHPPSNHTGLDYPVAITHAIFPYPHLHISHSYSPFYKVLQETPPESHPKASFNTLKKGRPTLQHSSKTSLPDLPSHQIVIPKTSIQKFRSPPSPSELSSHVTFPRNHSLDTVPHLSPRTDQVILP